uniref:Secreted protein n=1 Tax=Globodera rostochiensis TaxID=31243 RepID=A0A914H0Q5_GLORO
MSPGRFITFLLLVALCSLHSVVECGTGFIGMGAAPVESVWCATLGKESTKCPGGTDHNGGRYNGHRARRFA